MKNEKEMEVKERKGIEMKEDKDGINNLTNVSSTSD